MTSAFFLEKFCRKNLWKMLVLFLILYYHLLTYPVPVPSNEAIKEVYQRISYGKISYIVDADIKGFFDHIDHEWMIKFLEWNIQDKNLLWLIRKYLKAGIMEQGKFEPTEEGSAQGSVEHPVPVPGKKV